MWVYACLDLAFRVLFDLDLGILDITRKPILLTVLGPSTRPYYSLYWARVPEYAYSAHVTGPSTVSNRPILLTVLGPSTRPYYSLYWSRLRVLSTRSTPQYSE